MKPKLFHYRFKDPPFNTVKSFAYIQFYNHKTLLPLTLVVEVVHYFISHQNVVSNKTLRKESTLIFRNNLRKNNLEPIGKNFSNDFIGNIA